jgi:hypothetical protein
MCELFTPQQINEILVILKKGSKAVAIAYVRRHSSLGLKGALDTVDAIASAHFPKQNREGDGAMGMDAAVLVIGKFSPTIVPYLEYPEKYYRDTREGVTVTTVVCDAITTSESIYLAKILGISDPWDFNQYELDVSKIDFEALASDDGFGAKVAAKIRGGIRRRVLVPLSTQWLETRASKGSVYSPISSGKRGRGCWWGTWRHRRHIVTKARCVCCSVSLLL